MMTLNRVPEIALRIFGKVAESLVAPVAATVTSRVRACAMVLIGLVCQVAQMFCCLEILPTDSNRRGSKRATGLPNSGSGNSELYVARMTVPSLGATE